MPPEGDGEKVISAKFVAKAQAYAFIVNQDDVPSFVCDPKLSFKIEESDGKTFLCKHSDPGEDKKEDKASMQRYRVDGGTLGPKDIDMRLYLSQFQPIQDKILSLAADVGVNSSVWLLGRHSTQLSSNYLFNEQEEDDLFRATLSTLFARMSASTAQLNEFMRLSWTVHIKCFEVFGDQVVDLFLPADPTASRGNFALQPKVREHPELGTVVVGLTRRNFKSPADAYNALLRAFSQRRILIAETSVGSSRNLFGQRVLGTVGCVFIQVEIEQVLYPINLATENTFDRTNSFKICSNIQFNVMADIDALSYKPSRQDTVNIIPLNEFLLHGVKTSEDGRPKNAVTLNSSTLASSHKSLSALSRVLRIIHKQEGSKVDETSSTMSGLACEQSPTSSSQFIPYRDSVLTRVLQASLEGNYANLVYLCVSNESNTSVSHNLRMAMELRGMSQRLERKNVVLFDEPPPPLPAPTIKVTTVKVSPAKVIPVNNTAEVSSGQFVGQGKRQYVDGISQKLQQTVSGSRRESLREGTPENASELEDEEEVLSEKKVEESFWDTLARLQKDQNSFFESEERLANLEAERKKLFDSLELAVHYYEADSKERQRSGTAISLEVDLMNVYRNATRNNETEMDKEVKSPVISRLHRSNSSPFSQVEKSVSGDGSESLTSPTQDEELRADSKHLVPPPSMGSFSPTRANKKVWDENKSNATHEPNMASGGDHANTHLPSRQVPNRPIYTPLEIGSPVFNALPPSHVSSSTVGNEGGEGDEIHHHSQEQVGPSLDIEGKEPKSKVSLLPLRHAEAKSTHSHMMNVQLPSPFTGSFPATEGLKNNRPIDQKVHKNNVPSEEKIPQTNDAPDIKMHKRNNTNEDLVNESSMTDSLESSKQAAPSVYDNIDFVQLSLSTSNVHMNNPSSFIDVFEHQHETSGPKASITPQVTPIREYRTSKSLPLAASNSGQRAAQGRTDKGVLTGKNIWSSSPRRGSRQGRGQDGTVGRSPNNSSRRRHSDDDPMQFDNDHFKTAPRREPRPADLLTIPDLGLSKSDAKALSSNMPLPVKFQQSEPTITFPPLQPLRLVDDEDVMVSSGSPSPIRVSVTKKHKSSAMHISDECSDDETDEKLSAVENSFLQAVAHSNFGAVKKYVAQGVNVNVKNSFERDAMQIASRNGSLDIIKFLVRNGAVAATRGKRGDTLFHVAGGNGHIHVLRWLADQGLMHTLLDSYGQSVAHVAARRGEVDVLRYLHDHLHMSLHEEDFDGLTPIQHVPKRALQGNGDELIETRNYLVSVQDED